MLQTSPREKISNFSFINFISKTISEIPQICIRYLSIISVIKVLLKKFPIERVLAYNFWLDFKLIETPLENSQYWRETTLVCGDSRPGEVESLMISVWVLSEMIEQNLRAIVICWWLSSYLSWFLIHKKIELNTSFHPLQADQERVSPQDIFLTKRTIGLFGRSRPDWPQLVDSSEASDN